MFAVPVRTISGPKGPPLSLAPDDRKRFEFLRAAIELREATVRRLAREVGGGHRRAHANARFWAAVGWVRLVTAAGVPHGPTYVVATDDGVEMGGRALISLGLTPRPRATTRPQVPPLGGA